MKIYECKQKGYVLSQLLPHVYHLHFDDAYQLAMHFLRAQEFYESPKFADKLFTLVDYMEWYAKEYGKGAFSYAKDWSGFNVPSWVLDQVYGAMGTRITDFNKYDERMIGIMRRLWDLEKQRNFYLIGTSSAGYKGNEREEDVLDHEIAHALYYTNTEYKRDVESLLTHLTMGSQVMGRPYFEAERLLQKGGYHERTIRDEIHAYASTGVKKTIEGLDKVLTPNRCLPFEENFQKWKKKLKGS